MANVLTLLLAGEDTTAHSLAWAMYFICQDKYLQAKLHVTSADAFGSSPLCPTFEDVKKLDLFEFCYAGGVSLQAGRASYVSGTDRGRGSGRRVVAIGNATVFHVAAFHVGQQALWSSRRIFAGALVQRALGCATT
jgi:hypothetical protein